VGSPSNEKEMKHRVVVGVTGASGAIYAKVLFDRLVELKDQLDVVGVVFSSNAKDVWEYELGNRDFEQLPFAVYAPNDFFAPFASGSAGYDSHVDMPLQHGHDGAYSHGSFERSDDACRRCDAQRAQKADSAAARHALQSDTHQQYEGSDGGGRNHCACKPFVLQPSEEF
jgi:hypothetical protein